ncbi:MAG: universal stress protein, partial [Bacteroidota bacterium]
MKKTYKILVPFDFSEAAKSGLDYAVGFAGHRDDIEITLCYITEEKDLETITLAFEEKQAIYVDDLKLPMSWMLLEDSVTDSILKMKTEKEVDLIIMGTSGIMHAEAMNTHTSQLVLEADCPVFAIPQGHKKFNLEHMALVLGPNEIDDPKVLNTLLDMVRKFNSRVHVVTIEKEPNSYGYSEADTKNENILQYYLEGFYEDHTLIKSEDLVEGILTHTKDKKIDAIAILPRNHTKKTSPSEGKLTRQLILHSEIPILAI